MFSYFDTLEVLRDTQMGSNHSPMITCFKSKLFQKINEKTSFSLNFKKANWPLYQTLLPKNSPIPISNDINKLNNFVVQSLLRGGDSKNNK